MTEGNPAAVGASVALLETAETGISKGNVTTRDVAGIAFDAAVSALTQGVVNALPGVPGALPKNALTPTFFAGAHAMQEYANAAMGAMIDLGTKGSHDQITNHITTK